MAGAIASARLVYDPLGQGPCHHSLVLRHSCSCFLLSGPSSSPASP